jgi:hypothetical protein
MEQKPWRPPADARPLSRGHFPALAKCQPLTSLLSGRLEPNTHHQATAVVVISPFCAAATAVGDIGLGKLAGGLYSDSGLLSLLLHSPVKSRRSVKDSMAHYGDRLGCW